MDLEGAMSELPFGTALEEAEYKELIDGPRFSSCQSYPQSHFGPVTIRMCRIDLSLRLNLSLLPGNYVAGYVMQSLRKSNPKITPQFQSVFMNLPSELQLMASNFDR